MDVLLFAIGSFVLLTRVYFRRIIFKIKQIFSVFAFFIVIEWIFTITTFWNSLPAYNIGARFLSRRLFVFKRRQFLIDRLSNVVLLALTLILFFHLGVIFKLLFRRTAAFFLWVRHLIINKSLAFKKVFFPVILLGKLLLVLFIINWRHVYGVFFQLFNETSNLHSFDEFRVKVKGFR